MEKEIPLLKEVKRTELPWKMEKECIKKFRELIEHLGMDIQCMS